ncbi:MAG TPA: RNA-binding protein, partial [Candidatus Nitrosotenuis sp.]|nr:RNA-binding protein [Candidatus Nitrosotenuis sp.]
EIPSNISFGVSDEAYVMGLLDCIGELKRHVFDRIRNGDLEDAKRIFGIMENLYLMLYPLASYDKILKETRRKLDVNRGLVEDVRGAITEEIRRNELINAIKNLKLN